MTVSRSHSKNERPQTNPLKPVFLLFCISMMLSCSTSPYSRETLQELPGWLKGRELPVRVAVLPFENLTESPELEELVRRSFYSHFALKNYRDIELQEVDRALQILKANSGKTWKDLSPQAAGDFFQADFLIYGKVMDCSKFFAGVYSQVSLKVQVEMVECRNGNGVWWKTALKRSHEGGVPFTLFGVIPEAVRTGLHLTHERTLDLIERLNREIVADIPNPPLARSSPYFLDVQVGSFLEMEFAVKARDEIQGEGYRARVESVKTGNRTYHRVLVGPYQETAEAEAAKSFLSERGLKPILVHHRPEQKQ